MSSGLSNVELWWLILLQKWEDHARLGTKLCRTFANSATGKSTNGEIMDANGEMPLRSPCTTHASMELLLIEEEETLQQAKKSP